MSKTPNILFIVTDDHRADALGAAGHPVVRTPALDALASRGVRFSRAAHMGSLMPAVCSPARAALLTGVNPLKAAAAPGVYPDTGSGVALIRPDLQTLPQLLAAAGYQTFLTGKWHNDTESLLAGFSDGEMIFESGMCSHNDVPVRSRAEIAAAAPKRTAPGFSTEVFCGAAERFIRERTDPRPFFAWVALTSPHDPRMPPPEWRRLYEPEAKLPLPPSFRPEPAFDNGELAIRDELLVSKPLTPAVIREHLADYYGMISHQDEHIGRVLTALRATGREENTIVVYVGDHGLALGSHGLLGKQNLYEHSLRVPLIVAGPGIARGEVSEGLVYSFDLFATLLEQVGVPVPAGVDARSFGVQLRTPAQPARSVQFGFYRSCQRMTCAGDWKLIEYRPPAGNTQRELFNLAADALELDNRANDPATELIQTKLLAQLHKQRRTFGDQWMTLGTTP